MSRATGLYELLQSEHAESALARQIDGFGLTGVCCTRELVLTDQLSRMARALHEAYIFDRQRNANDAASKSNDSLRPWETLDETYRESNREQAEHLELKLRTFGFSAADSNPRLPSTFTDVQIELLGHMEHSRWCAERELAGWTYAPGPKNAENRTSPDLVPWDKLPLNVRKIDFDFVKAIPRTLATCKTT